MRLLKREKVGDVEQTVLEIDGEVRIMSLVPGDTIVVKMGRMVGQAEADAVKNAMEGYFPDNKVLVHGPDMDLTVITPAENRGGGGWLPPAGPKR